MKLRAGFLVLGWVLFVVTAVLPVQGQALDSELSAATKSRCVSILNEAIHDEAFPAVIHAAEALTRAGRGHAVIGPFEKRLADETDDRKKCVWARELVRAGDSSKLSVMLDILARPDPYGHVHAAESLYKVDGKGDGKALWAAMGEGRDPILQIMAAGALAKHGDSDAMKLLRARLADRDLKTSRIAAWVLGRIGGPADIPVLREGVRQSSDDLTRCYFEHSLAALGDAEGLKALDRNLTHEDKLIRAYAATFAGDAGAVALAPTLLPLLHDPVTDVRVRACQTLLVFDRLSSE
jgi:sialidase-1